MNMRRMPPPRPLLPLRPHPPRLPPLRPLPPPPAATAAGEVIKAPMPGNILKINCAQGASVKAGDILLILEAMKMENEILAPRDGVVAQVVTSKGSVVETGTPLVVLA
jgi:biotin carboxyl carrier protein